MEEKNQNEILKKFIEISKKRWVKGVNNSSNSVGLTFESLLDKNADSMYFPDYCGIEIKCSQRFSGYPISLFSKSFDGPNLYEMNRLLNTYGKKDVKYTGKFLLQGSIYTNKYAKINSNYFKLRIDRESGKIIVSIYDLNYCLIEEKAYVEFETIKSRLELKLSRMALVLASKKIIDNDLYFRYYKMTIYKLKSFETFIELLEKDKIKVSIIGRISRTGTEEGRQRNKNLVFSIDKGNIDLLFDKIIEYNHDLNINY